MAFADAAQDADLGLPVPTGTRFRTLKRAVARLLWLTNRRQVAFNHTVLTLLEEFQARQRAGAQPAIGALDQIFAEQLAALHGELAAIVVAEQETATAGGASDAQLHALTARVDRLTATLATIERRQTEMLVALDELRERERLLPRPVREPRSVPADVAEFARAPALDGVARPELDAALHDAFRGPSAEVRRRLEVYLPLLTETPRGRVLDLGPGRGELLELLHGTGVDAYGVECNPVFVERCRARGLDVVEMDALSHLTKLPDDSLAAVTAIHVAEHLSFDGVVTLLDEAWRALQPGGVLILETPNVDNLTVGASSFYLDPTHRTPLPPALLRALLIARGYDDVEVRYLQSLPSPLEPPASGRNPTTAIVECLNAQLFGPRDVSAVGRRPSGSGPSRR